MAVRSNSRPRRIALAFPIRFGHMPIVVKGITDYTDQKNEWIFTTSAESFNFSVRSMRGWRGDGAIVVLNNEDDAAAAQQLGIPVVTVGWVLRSPGVPRVHTDNYGIGKLAADHLLSCRFKNFGYYGISEVAYSEDRLKASRPQVENEVPPSTSTSPPTPSSPSNPGKMKSTNSPNGSKASRSPSASSPSTTNAPASSPKPAKCSASASPPTSASSASTTTASSANSPPRPSPASPATTAASATKSPNSSTPS